MTTSLWPSPLSIDGNALDDRAQWSIQVRIDPAGGVARHRLSDGSLVQQVAWRRRKLVLSAEGWLPSGLEDIDWDLPHTFAGQTITGQFTGFSDGPQKADNPQKATFGWTLTVEER